MYLIILILITFARGRLAFAGLIASGLNFCLLRLRLYLVGVLGNAATLRGLDTSVSNLKLSRPFKAVGGNATADIGSLREGSPEDAQQRRRRTQVLTIPPIGSAGF